MAAPLDPREAKKAARVTGDAQISINPEKGDDESPEEKTAEEKKGMNGFLVRMTGQLEAAFSSVPMEADKLRRPILQRIFTFGDTKLYILECIAFIAAIVSGVALAMVNLVMGQFLTLLSDVSFSNADSRPGNFMSAVRMSAYEHYPPCFDYK